MSSLAGVWAAVWGLLVEDGSLAIGIVAALAATWIAAVILTDAARNQVGWLLLGLLLILVVLNLRAAGRRARGNARGTR
jgi:fucose permease